MTIVRREEREYWTATGDAVAQIGGCVVGAVVRVTRGWSVAVPTARRGAGLGNEAIPLAKALIASEVLGLRLVQQPWFVNPRDYSSLFGRGYADGARHGWAYASRHRRDLSAADLSHPFDYLESMRDLAARGVPDTVLLRHVSGMSGGFLGVLSARSSLQRLLGISASSPRHEGIRIGVHLRLGDFAPAQNPAPGRWNTSIPAPWSIGATLAVISALRAVGEECVSVTLCTDSPDSAAAREVESALAPVVPVVIDVGDVVRHLALLSASDVIVPSISWFSTLALFLGQQPYVWPSGNLVAHGTLGSINGQSPEVLAGPTGVALEAIGRGEVGSFRGLPWGLGDTLSSDWASAVVSRRRAWDVRGDLTLYGAAPMPTDR